MSSPKTKTRQKSCIACANAKRRCDRRTPICTQCVGKSILCEYKGSVKPRMERPPISEISIDTPVVSRPETNGLSQPLLDYPNSSVPTDFPRQINPMLDVDETFLDMYDMQLLHDPLPLPRIGTMDRPRATWIIKALRSYPTLLLTTTRTPFIHPLLFSPTISSPLQDAISACSLYLAKNETNGAVVWEVISSMIAKLLQPMPNWAVAEHLSCVQSLVIFQIIRLFDGDVRARGDAEEAEVVLNDWTDRLALRTGIVVEDQDNASFDAGYVIEKSWESWVFEESVKRTVIVSRMVSAMYSVLKKGYCTYVEKVTELSFTAGKELWDAGSAVHWRLVMEAQKSLDVQRMELDEILGKARLEDVDELGLLMLVTYKGVDGVNEWIVQMGSKSLIDPCPVGP
ncbi:uncharacterized protein LY89DRAFT_668169 [Mollisia scopiformis]|uniref:Zn(2)-C6 fungal-type domain-containing protein n=1 Tax=Mollisia scopiformis TaxID=149040 RepID=A0A194XCR8_MOLSC|nr:uncharacterized protein LY89DRAFT_668169 [Mollisia scopiformis]KUJ17965.1 hypothetical protein LY89DRAFT_668169 [Mollisia scopiformis]